MKKIYMCDLKIISLYHLEKFFNKPVHTSYYSDYINFNLINNDDIERFSELKCELNNYLAKHEVSIEGLKEDDLIQIKVNEKNRKEKSVPKYLYQGRFYITKTINPNTVKEIITGNNFSCSNDRVLSFSLKNYVTAERSLFKEVNTLERYDMLKNYLLNKDIIKEFLNIINNFCLEEFEKYKVLNETNENNGIKVLNKKKKEVEDILKNI